MTTSSQPWRPTLLGRLFTASPSWTFQLSEERFTLSLGGLVRSDSAEALDGISARRGLLWATIELPNPGGPPLYLRGLSNDLAVDLLEAVIGAIEGIHRREAVAQRLSEFNSHIGPLVEWARATADACRIQLRRRGWLGQEVLTRISAAKPNQLTKALQFPDVQEHLSTQSDGVQKAVDFWDRPIEEVVSNANQRRAERAEQEDAEFFNKVEKSPLTEEQRKAVICFDNRVLLVASAGSGKTSTMVAKAGYALKHGYFEADKMLLLAFNKSAADELGERIKARLTPLGLPAEKVAAKTFHAFGLEVIGKATGKRPSLASWLEGGQDQDTILAIADELKDRDQAFRVAWDMFRLVFGQDLPKFGTESDAPDSWDPVHGRGFWTLNNEVVKSRGEVIIANWLFYNGVRYEYERPYEKDTATSDHRQYQPDFYLPDANAYLEHWGVDKSGEPPEGFAGYKESMKWKRELHSKYGTKLLETTTAGLYTGEAFRYLSGELFKLGVTLDPNPDRQAPGRQPIESPRLAKTIRSVLTHVKNNRLTVEDLRTRVKNGAAGEFRFRHELFLRLFEKVWEGWEAKLRAANVIDFEDMLNMATDCVEKGQYVSPYELVMVDEFQDASQARSHLISSLVREPDRYLFAVGDDWQSINRFAGADLAVMTGFESAFGKGTVLRLEATFRCPQSLCDISSSFVQKNPRQLKKKVRSAQGTVDEPVRIISVDHEAYISAVVQVRVNEIAKEAAALGKRAKVFILGRYRKESSHKPMVHDSQAVDLQFMTVHSSKGLEADHIIVPGMHSAGLGFPSRAEDDPVVHLAMAGGDSFEHAEERRLFYVALTRARSSVTLITLTRKESEFVSELVKDQKLTVRNPDGEETSTEVCPTCGKGFVIPKIGRFGLFFSCSAFPLCTYKRNGPKSSNRARYRQVTGG